MSLFQEQKPFIGMVHLLPLPETPNFGGEIRPIIERALQDSKTLVDAGVDGIIIENFGDEPYLIGEPTTAQLALISAITNQIQAQVSIPIGINVQFNAWQAEIALAYACQAQFIRVEVFVDTVVSAQGIVEPCSAQITRYRQQLGADQVQIWADIQTKYTTNLLPQSIQQSAIDATNAGADAIIVTGGATGEVTPLDTVREVKDVTPLPVYVGSGTNAENAQEVFTVADGAIVGSAIKEAGQVRNPVSYERTQAFIQHIRSISNNW